MSFAIRNSLILIIVLIVINVTGWGFIHFKEWGKIDKLEQKLKSKNTKLENSRRAANQFDYYSQRYKEVNEKFQNFNKFLPPSLNASQVYAYLSSISNGDTFTQLNFTFKDSTIHEKYGVIHSKINGTGLYPNLFNMISLIEENKPINKIKNLIIEPVSGNEQHNMVNFSFDLDSYYNRSKVLRYYLASVNKKSLEHVFNPFYPLIRTVKPNTNNLSDIDQSKLVSVSKNMIYLVDQNGKVKSLKVGDEVYLGALQSIDMKNKSATFYLNRGGIIDMKTLTVQ
ncbi:MAG TPA: type 4a pilus biogenesis protein PilO [Balneolales bacterium]|nr:type 4a pilus biogenesis protein PilO [Balneolales bacterium]